jgi:hypothetical protein
MLGLENSIINTTLIDIAPYETSLDPVLGYVSEHGTER